MGKSCRPPCEFESIRGSTDRSRGGAGTEIRLDGWARGDVSTGVPAKRCHSDGSASKVGCGTSRCPEFNAVLSGGDSSLFRAAVESAWTVASGGRDGGTGREQRHVRR